ncbi:cobalamin biosynthesis protein [Nitrosopumilus sp.]|uniref:cobalamin biosynthesis protein n=1 Tax=Nitrosopumilus sp. TaxID=2024843 RepID=UPI002610415A|nr:cobalamin biosynthesis protein [Nitrosopumilus sp.]
MILESILIIGFAILLDFKFGDPKSKFHPTAWIGNLIAKLVPTAKNPNHIVEKIGGIMILSITAGIVFIITSGIVYGFSLISDYFVSVIVSVIVGGILVKTTFAIRGMENHAKAVLDSLDANKLENARDNLSMIVKRDTSKLDQNHVISGVLESISENTVDGITGPMFYYALFGLPGAFVYRVVNTADSMIGYKTDLFKNIGWFTAKCDTVLNYIPSRLTGFLMIIAAALLQNNWKESYKIMVRDGRKTESPNAGYPMAALAGALGTKFEKIDHYQLGDGEIPLSKKHVYSAISLMKITSLLFFGIVVIPIITILSMLGWWIHA